MQSSSPGRVGTVANPRREVRIRPASQARRGRSPTRPGDPREHADQPGRTMVRVTAGTRPSYSPYAVFDRGSWRALAAGSTLPLDEEKLRSLATLGDRIDLDEVATVYLPLARLLGLHVTGSRSLWAAQSTFLGDTTAKVPF